MSQKQYKTIFTLGLVVFLLFLIFTQTHKNILPLPITEAREETTSFTVVVSGETIPLSVRTRTSLYDALLLAKENKQIIFSGKNYPVLGFFVTDIGSLHTGDGKNLIYYINNKEANVGVSSYLPKDGDIILWKLE